MSKDPLAPLPLLPRAGSAVGGPPPGAAALKTSSLSRMPELQQYLRQCDDQNYLKNYVKVGAGCGCEQFLDSAAGSGKECRRQQWAVSLAVPVRLQMRCACMLQQTAQAERARKCCWKSLFPLPYMQCAPALPLPTASPPLHPPPPTVDWVSHLPGAVSHASRPAR